MVKSQNISILRLIFPLRVTVFMLSLFFLWRPVVVLFKTKMYVVFKKNIMWNFIFLFQVVFLKVSFFILRMMKAQEVPSISLVIILIKFIDQPTWFYFWVNRMMFSLEHLSGGLVEIKLAICPVQNSSKYSFTKKKKERKDFAHLKE